MTLSKRVRGRSLFRKYNVEKLVRSAKGAGMEVGGVEVTADGTIRVLAKDATGNATDYDNWVAKRNAHST